MPFIETFTAAGPGLSAVSSLHKCGARPNYYEEFKFFSAVYYKLFGWFVGRIATNIYMYNYIYTVHINNIGGLKLNNR